MPSDPLIVIARLAQIFDELQILYVVGGSIASSIYGIPRAAQNVDIMANIKLGDVDPLKAALEPEFYVASELIADAVRQQTYFNMVHLQTLFKADVFVAADNGWSHEEMNRARPEAVLPNEGPAIRFSSPEDIILHKLLWYRTGGHESGKQWDDVLGVLQIQGSSLDFTYLERWAASMDVGDLLSGARKDAEIDSR